MAITTFQIPAEGLGHGLAHDVRQLFEGKTNNVLDVTVTTSATSTTVTDARIGVNTVALCTPANAGAFSAGIPYRDMSAPVNGSMSLIHANDGNTKTYKVVLIG